MSIDDLMVEKADLEDELAELRDREDGGEDVLAEICRVRIELDEVKNEINNWEDGYNNELS